MNICIIIIFYINDDNYDHNIKLFLGPLIHRESQIIVNKINCPQCPFTRRGYVTAGKAGLVK